MLVAHKTSKIIIAHIKATIFRHSFISVYLDFCEKECLYERKFEKTKLIGSVLFFYFASFILIWKIRKKERQPRVWVKMNF